ncbi:putative phospholipid hydroperoxide glutathione peroxidase isoform X5 [Apium graveolens]|uniref:putative phospholipid hydroperoxide glutathione peroxidase isoform X5 n=1 Tax=Apium graveolens TaxID=4045 RepID=UPI003D7AC71F
MNILECFASLMDRSLGLMKKLKILFALVSKLNILSSVDVNGSDAAPLYKYLKSVKGDEIEWNFAMFLVDKDGKLVERYAPTTTTLSFENDIKKVLGVA